MSTDYYALSVDWRHRNNCVVHLCQKLYFHTPNLHSMTLSEKANSIFKKCVEDYHVYDDIDHEMNNPYEKGTLEQLLYLKCWIDSVQWHLEDIIRDPDIDPGEALVIKRRIDKSNQHRTDTVEALDLSFYRTYKDIPAASGSTMNTETPAWALDRLSILSLKIYHMREEATREDATKEHLDKCRQKLEVLLEQQLDLSTAIDNLIKNIESGDVRMKMYLQMKMYNDPALNPILYQDKSK